MQQNIYFTNRKIKTIITPQVDEFILLEVLEMERIVRINLGRVMDKASALELREKFDNLLQKGCNEFELDMSNLRCINLAGLASIYYISKKTCDNGFILRFLSPNTTIRKILMITNADMYAQIIEKYEFSLDGIEKSISERYENNQRNLEEFVLNIVSLVNS